MRMAGDSHDRPAAPVGSSILNDLRLTGASARTILVGRGAAFFGYSQVAAVRFIALPSP